MKGKGKDTTLKLTTGHGPGQASLAYVTVAGKGSKEHYVATAGADGKVYLRDSLILEPVHMAKVDAPPATILAVDPAGKFVAVGDDKNVKLYKVPSLSLEKVACRFALTLRALAFSPDGSKLAAAGDDSVVKLVDLKDGTVYRTLNCDEYVLSLAWDPLGTYLAASLRTGGLVLYDASTGKAVKRLDMSEQVDYSSPRRHTPCWHPDGGTVLAAPTGAEGDVVLLERLSWAEQGYLGGEHTKAVNVVAFSPNGLYVATAGQDKRLVVWDLAAASSVASAVAEEVMSGLAWKPEGNELAMVGESGGVGVWSSPVPTSHASPTASAEELEAAQRQQERQADAKRRAEKGRKEGEAMDLTPPEGGEIREEIIEEGIQDPADPDPAAARPTSSGAGGSEGGDEGGPSQRGGADGMGEGEGEVARGGRTHAGRAAAAAGRPVATRTIVRTIVAPPAGPNPQPPFQPGSTPPEAGKARFLCFNMIGSVSSRPTGDHNMIEVLFHDTSRFSARVPQLKDLYGFDRAALGDKGVLYSSPSAPGSEAEGGPAPSMLCFRPFDSWAPHSDWTAPLPPGEEAMCLASGSVFSAVATSRLLLRLFSLAGSQTALLRLDGPPLAMAAAGPLLLVAFHSGPPNQHTKSQSISVSLYDTIQMACVFTQPLPLTPGASLSWLGFTEDHGLPAVADSEGVIAVRTPDWGGRWVPVFEPPAARRSAEALWTVGLTAQQLYAVVCRAEAPRPPVSPRPYYTPMDLAPPVLALESGAAPEAEGRALLHLLSCGALRGRLDAAQLAGAVAEASDLTHLYTQEQYKADRELLRVFQKAVRGERHARALELAAQMASFKSLDGALKIANHNQARGLAERIREFMDRRQAEAEALPPLGGGMEEQAGPYEAAAGAAAGRRGHACTPIPFGRGVEAAEAREAAADAPSAGGAGGTQQQPLGPADLNAGAGGGGGGGLTPFAEMVTAPGSAGPNTGGLSTGPKGGRGLPTPNTLLQVATAKPDPGSDSHKRKPAPALNNPFARKAPKLAK
ncbi:hypothetical protein HYH03_015955 [Edaphochlamys debaryana]|uniref:Minichromosome loss protein Mcl1 middle region domain-containing protein n=1 Tax=Edaphochlamys debaryana TaxID=47281 RepID=A0A835XKW3_9CHLO|nr:hypothetical protein HYH03_015955 [Edaphochlamys debaryana]|eukprot:KAG2485280.1 hypothetical protein HYH03_015955 [Edaphochlamys debaryana]